MTTNNSDKETIMSRHPLPAGVAKAEAEAAVEELLEDLAPDWGEEYLHVRSSFYKEELGNL